MSMKLYFYQCRKYLIISSIAAKLSILNRFKRKTELLILLLKRIVASWFQNELKKEKPNYLFYY